MDPFWNLKVFHRTEGNAHLCDALKDPSVLWKTFRFQKGSIGPLIYVTKVFLYHVLQTAVNDVRDNNHSNICKHTSCVEEASRDDVSFMSMELCLDWPLVIETKLP